MSEVLYTREILRLAVSIPHQGRMDNPDASAEVRSKTCGSRAIADITIDKDRVIRDLGLEINACALGQASAAIVGGEAVGRSMADFEKARQVLSDYLAGSTTSPGEWKNIDQLSAARNHKGRHAAILLPFDAIIGAFKQLNQAHPGEQGAAK